MSQDTTSRPPSTEEPARPAPFIPCSDCRQPMRNHYFALDSRPVCPKCRTGYEKRISYGRNSLGRVLLWAGGAALAGSVVLGIFSWYVGFFRLLMSVGVAYFVAKAINKATGDYYMRRNQIIGVALVYFAVGLSAFVPIVVKAVTAPAVTAAATPADSAAAAAAAAEQAEDDAEAAELDASLTDETVQQSAAGDGSIEDRKAQELRSAGVLKGIFVALVMFLTLPLLSAIGFGLAGTGASLLALGYAMKYVWDHTADGVSYQVTGPHRVGQGPIPTTW